MLALQPFPADAFLLQCCFGQFSRSHVLPSFVQLFHWHVCSPIFAAAISTAPPLSLHLGFAAAILCPVQPFSVLALQPFPAAVSPAALSQPFLRSHFLPYLICGDLLSSRFDCSHFISLQFFVQVVSNESFSAAAFAAFIFHSGFCAKFCSCFFTGKEDALSLQQFFWGENCRSCGIYSWLLVLT